MARPSHVLVPFPALAAFLVVILILSLAPQHTLAQQNSKCGEGNECRVGCCSKEGVCGFSEDHCGTGCISNCDAKAECGQYAPEGEEDCPINVCCSEHGFCGVTEEFCGDGCQDNSNGEGCGEVCRSAMTSYTTLTRTEAAVRNFPHWKQLLAIDLTEMHRSQECDVDHDPFNLDVRAAYYELFTKGRECGVKEPEDLPLEPLTHVHLAFVNFDDTFQLSHEHSDWIKRMVNRKIQHPHIKMTIAIGGWAFNDPPTSHLFSDMANYYDNRQTFVQSVVDFLRTYGLDGVDIDWEYPAAKDRGGIDEDTQAYVLLLSDLRDAFDAEVAGWEISIAIPSSYWYLRGFDLFRMQDYVDYFNLMSYDIHGMWDLDNEWTGPYLKGHTDWRKIDEGLDLLWRNYVRPQNVVMGFGFYGRSFTMESPGCFEPNGVCRASDGGLAGSCTNEPGVLTYYEVASRNESGDVDTYYDAKNTVKYSVWNRDQWISIDDQQSFHDKLGKLSSKCLAGLMIWAIDQDTSDYQALHGLLGDFSHTGIDKGMSDEDLADRYAQYTGQDCFVTEKCTSAGSQRDPKERCPSGYKAVALAHDPVQRWPMPLDGDCEEGEWRLVCCPTDAMPLDCSWNGDPVRNVIGCTGQCGSGYFELNSDSYVDYRGEEPCYQGSKKLCCESTKILDDCYWTDCEGPLFDDEFPECRAGYERQTYRHDKPDGDGLCREEYGNNGSPHVEPFKSSLCCPKERMFEQCNWANDPVLEEEDEPFPQHAETWCRIPRPCRDDQIKVADATYPPIVEKLGPRGLAKCDALEPPSGYDKRINYCCAPQDTWGHEDWPVDPEHLWEHEFDDPDTDSAMWEYESHHSNNDQDETIDGSHEIDGDDSYGFMMLNGPRELLDDTFGETHEVVRQQKEKPKVKRSVLTTNQTLLESVFDHAEETFYVYCNYRHDSEACQRIFIGGAEDTIIRLPPHVGEGPFARLVSMEKAPSDYQLPQHHLQHRDTDGLTDNPVFEVKIDYDFARINAEEGHVNIRVDYTNLMEYWDEVTSSPAKRSRIKRGLPEFSDDGPFRLKHFRDRVKRAHETEKANPLRKRKADPIKATIPIHLEEKSTLLETGVAKRWWGAFKDWLRKSTTVSDESKGDLPLDFASKIRLFNQRWGCPGKGYTANLRMDLEASFAMQATYAYYYSGTFVPPSKPDLFFYFGIEPEAYLGLSLEGNVRLNATSHRTKIIDTLSYPGLAIKGIAAVGPTLDVYGQIRGFINIQGKARAGAKVSFGRAEAYWPQDEALLEEYDEILDLELKEDPEIPEAGEVTPVFEAGVKIEAGLDIIVQPEANIGIKVGGGSWTAGRSIIDAQITGFVRGILQFFAEARSGSSPTKWNYAYGVYLFYNVGYNARATVLEWADWALGERTAYEDDRKITIFRKDGSIDLNDLSRRDLFDTGNATISAIDDTVFNKRQTDGDGDTPMGDPDKPRLTTPESAGRCPSGGSEAHQLPELRFNCGAFPVIELRKTENSPLIHTGTPLCQAYIAAQADGRILTHAPALGALSSKAVENRRKKQCGGANSNICASTNADIEEGWGRSKNPPITECDEFPWASSEEGGEFFEANLRSQRCIPAVQNGDAGDCIKMMSELATNVGKLEPEGRDEDKKDCWVVWADVSKGTTNAENSLRIVWEREHTYKCEFGDTDHEVKQRLKDYPNIVPVPAGKDSADGSSWHNQKKSWVFRRQYKLSLANVGDGGFWDAEDHEMTDTRNTKRYTSLNNVLCAVNIFGQTDVYEEPPNYNAWCFTDEIKSTRYHWPRRHRVAKCKIDFGLSGGDGNEKRNWNGWPVKSVQLLEGEEADEKPYSSAQMFGIPDEDDYERWSSEHGDPNEPLSERIGSSLSEDITGEPFTKVDVDANIESASSGEYMQLGGDSKQNLD
ncbi:Killer toxin subunits alpha/beta [Paramyrothecium foliicola]|nr:Killer toxin subunits alpha/beta [Paramyrothecium foliicola]